jgi:hypothetical protein
VLEDHGIEASMVIDVLVEVVLVPALCGDGVLGEPDVFRFREAVVQEETLMALHTAQAPGVERTRLRRV